MKTIMQKYWVDYLPCESVFPPKGAKDKIQLKDRRGKRFSG